MQDPGKAAERFATGQVIKQYPKNRTSDGEFLYLLSETGKTGFFFFDKTTVSLALCKSDFYGTVARTKPLL